MLPVVVDDACLVCSMGCTPSNLIVLPSDNCIDGKRHNESRKWVIINA